MLESLVASILNRFLKNYVSNLNYDQLKIGIWNGEVNLRNLKLRRDALDKLDLPINVSEGYLGELTLIIPWSNLRNEPVKVIIDHVYLLAEPKNESTVTVEEEEERAQELKRRRLSTAEMLESPEAQTDQKKDANNKGSDGFITQLTNKIVDNLQFTMKNIHIRYEDKISDPGHPFAAGITLKELSALSTDEEWVPKFISEPTNTINKLATLESLSVYWNTDARSLTGMHHEEAAQLTFLVSQIPCASNSPREHQYILKPVSGTGKVKLNKNYGGDIPKTDVTMLFDELAFGLDDHQYRDAILMIDLFHANLKKQKYLKFHPEKGKTVKSHPREFFQFAGKAILSEIHEKNYKWTWDHFRKRRDQRLQYIECYIADKMKKATPEQLDALKQLEYDLSFEDIRFYRSIAKSKLRREKIRINKENEKKKAENAKVGWWGWLSGATPAANSQTQDTTDDDTGSIHITEEQKKELYDVIEYDEDKATIASAVDIPKDTIKFAIKTKLNRGSFTLKQDVKKPTELDLLSIVFDAVSIDVTQYLESMKVAAALGDLQLFDGSTKDTIYHQLIGVKKKNNREKSSSLLEIANAKEADPFFSIVFEKKPLSNKADNAFSLKMRHLEIIYSPVVIAGIIKFFKPPSSKMESVNALIAVAGDTFEGFKTQTRAGLEFALETHTTLDLNVDMDAPIIIIPESLTSQDSPVMIIDAGHINVDSQLADKAVVNDIKNKDIQKYSKRDAKTLEDLMYDKFNLQLSQTKVLIGSNTKECLWQLQDHPPRHGVDARFIERIDMNFLIEVCILPGKTEFTKFKVSGQLPLLSINLSDSKYKILMRIVDFIVPTSDDDTTATASPSQKRPQLQDNSNNTHTSTGNIITERYWGSRDDHALLLDDSGSEITSIGSRSDTPTTNTTASIASSQIEQFKLTFQVDKVSASIHETSAVDATKETLLCEILLESFELVVLTRPDDLLVDVSLKALSVADKMEHEGDFHYLVTSDIIDRKNAFGRTNDKNLVNVKYRKASRDHPRFQDVYQGYDQTVDVVLSTLTVVITRRSLLRIYNWIMNTFTAPPSAAGDMGKQVFEGDVFYDDASSLDHHSVLSDSLHLPKINSNRMKVAIHMDSVNLILNQEGKRLGTGELSFGDIIIMLEPNTIEVDGKFGNFTLSDDSSMVNTGNNDSVQTFNTASVSETYIISIVGDELADFTYKTYDPKAADYPGYNQKFDLKMGAIHLLVTESVKPTLNFLQEFLEMKNVYDAARNAAVETAQQIQQGTGTNRFHFDIKVKSPVLVFPARDTKATDTLIANLGEIRANNEFIEVHRRDLKNVPQSVMVPVTHINCGLYDISLYSTAVTHDQAGNAKEHVLPIIDNLNIVFDIENPEDPNEAVGPGSQIMGSISDVRMALTERQYKSLLETWAFIQKEFLTADTATTNTTEETLVSSDGGGASLSKSSSQSQLSTADVPSIKQVATKINLDLVIKLNTVYLELLTGQDSEMQDKEKHMLSRLAFDGICMKLQNMSNESMLMEVGIQSISFADTRSQSKSKFREILPANTLDGPQFQFKLWSYKDEHDATPVMDMKMTVDSPKIVLSLDYLFLLKDFFMGPFIVIEPTEAQKYAQSYGQERDGKEANVQQLQAQNQAPPTVMKYNINIIDLRVLCLANPENAASEAVILSFNQLTVIQQADLKVHLDGIGMVLCRMDNIAESTMHFVEEFNVLLSMETAATSTVHHLTTIKLNVEPIILRLSYQDAMLISTIANKVIALMGSPDQGAPAPKPSSSESIASDVLLLEDQSEAYLQHAPESTATLNHAEKPKGIEPFIVMSKESLSASFDGIQIILIEDLHDLPFVDVQINPFAIAASDWTRALKADVDFLLKANNFNFKNSHWEPIIEPWSFCIKVSQDATDKSTSVALESKDLLYLNITHTFLESLMAVSETLSQTKPLAQTAQTQVRPYLIRNFTGHDLRFWNMSDDVEKGDNRVFKLKQGETLPWTFRDWKKRRERVNLGKNLFGVQIDAFNWESILHVPVDTESERAYRLRPAVKEIDHRLIVDIHLENHIKTVTFRSGLVLQNNSSEEMQMVMVNKKRRMLSDVMLLKPYEIFNVPIELSYDRWVVVRPSDKYHWSTQMLMWSDVMLPKAPKSIQCLPLEDAAQQQLMPYEYQINVECDKKNPLVKQYPFLKVQFCPPIQVENLLPFDFDLTLTNEMTGETMRAFVEKGKTANLYNMKPSATLIIQLDLKSDRYKCSDTSAIHTTPNYNSTGEKITLVDHNDVPTNVKMNISRSSSTTDALHVSIYAPYLILNKTGLPICLRQRQGYRQGRSATEEIPAYRQGDTLEPIIFSYPDIDHKNRAQISINDSKWSEPISFEAVGNSQDVTLLSKQDAYARHAGIKVEEGTGILRLTKLVTITPRYIIKNNMDIALKFCEFGDDEVTRIDPGQKMPLYQTTKSSVRWLCLQLQELDGKWSSPFDIQEIGKTYVKVDKGDDTIPYLVRVSVHIKDSTIFITFNQDHTWPYYIVNRSRVPVRFRQEHTDFEEYGLKDKQKRAFQEPRTFTLQPDSTFKYSWDIPVAKEKRLELLVGNRHRSINFQAIGAQVPFRYMKHRDGGLENNTLSIDVIADDSALVLRLTDFDLSKSLYRPKSSGTSTLASTSREGSVRDAFETVTIQHVVNYVLELNLAGFGISLINRHAQEIAFASIKGLDFKYTDSNMYQSVRLALQWLQIDDQLYNSTYPILCYPTTLPKVSSELSTHPTLHIALDKVKDDRHGVLYFKLFSVLLQEMTFEIDEDFLYALLDFAHIASSTQKNKAHPSTCRDDLYIMTIEEPVVEKAEALYYFEEFCIQPMRLNLSFVRTEKLDDSDTSSSTKSSAMGYVFNVFTMTLGNINDAPIKLNALIVDNLRASSEDLTARIMLHYREQVIYQIHRVLGSIDILGNPVGLFNTLSSGFGELFYEPYQGFIMSDRPQDLGIGIAKGVGGFMKKGVFGISDSLSRFSGSLGKGVSAATMDKKFQDRRRMNMTRNKPTHAIYGVTQGVGYFGTSVASGFAGLVKRPIEGAESGGVVGFVGGVGKGLVGAFTKPMVGFLDMASNITAGIRETTTVFEGNDINRERLPRYTGKDGIVTAYSQREALGQMWLKEMESGKFFNEVYIAHSVVDNDEVVAILTYTRILIVRSDSLKLDYAISLDTIRNVESGDNGVYLELRKAPTRVLTIEESTSREWFAKNIKQVLNQREEERKRQ
ncbi:hypothetical protein MUCCIDRAFT_141025 [Mucor lusitanicus CBS 277.49]|uniref:Vacuolar protein sorting-associated protein n=1 Tax=Mucor lusitanicus CBS 277.49 TaxID=747725 RepID=A0A162MR88_MUCCL|nr:hypothetical protein MUCCIDRAFT_141025 [Mucor lusitanicus CBS 277.49]